MSQTQLIYDAPTGVGGLEDTDGLTWRELARGTAASEAEAQAASLASQGAVPELEDAQAWGLRVVRNFEAQALKGGINSDPPAALALDRYLREVSGAVAAGRLHVAWAALGELLKTPEAERPAPPFTDDASLVPIYNALAERLKLEPWRPK